MQARERRQEHVDGCHARRMKLCGEQQSPIFLIYRPEWQGHARLFAAGGAPLVLFSSGHEPRTCGPKMPRHRVHRLHMEALVGPGVGSGVCSADGKHRRNIRWLSSP